MDNWPLGTWKLGTRLRKKKGSCWQGRVVGFYSTSLTPVGYAIESEREPGSVQIYPASALEPVPANEPLSLREAGRRAGLEEAAKKCPARHSMHGCPMSAKIGDTGDDYRR